MARLASSAVVVDLTTHAAGLLIRSRLPRAIAAMEPGSDYLTAFAHRPPDRTTTIAGAIDPSDPVEANTLGFLRGDAPTAFGRHSNDLWCRKTRLAAPASTRSLPRTTTSHTGRTTR